MKRRQFLKTVPAIAAVPVVAQEILKAAVEDDLPMTATDNGINAAFIRQYDQTVRDLFARDAGIAWQRKVDSQILAKFPI